MGKKKPADFRQTLSRRLLILVKSASCRNARSPQQSHSTKSKRSRWSAFLGSNKCICFRVMDTWKFISCVSKLYCPGFFLHKNIHAFSITFCLTFCEVSFDARVGPLKDAHFHKRPFVEVIYGRYDMALKLLMFIHDTSRKRRLSQEAHYCESLTLLGLYLKLQLQPKGVFAGIFRGVTV